MICEDKQEYPTFSLIAIVQHLKVHHICVCVMMVLGSLCMSFVDSEYVDEFNACQPVLH